MSPGPAGDLPGGTPGGPWPPTGPAGRRASAGPPAGPTSRALGPGVTIIRVIMTVRPGARQWKTADAERRLGRRQAHWPLAGPGRAAPGPRPGPKFRLAAPSVAPGRHGAAGARPRQLRGAMSLVTRTRSHVAVSGGYLRVSTVTVAATTPRLNLNRNSYSSFIDSESPSSGRLSARRVGLPRPGTQGRGACAVTRMIRAPTPAFENHDTWMILRFGAREKAVTVPQVSWAVNLPGMHSVLGSA